MKVKRLLFTVIGSILAALNLMSAAPVLAQPPEVWFFHEEGTIEEDCGTFSVINEYVVDARVSTFFDRFGEPVKVRIIVNLDGQLTNLETGKILHNPSHHMCVEDLVAGTFTDVGLEFAITVPGEGIAVLDAGRIVFEGDQVIFQGGPRQFLFSEDGWALICAALDLG